MPARISYSISAARRSADFLSANPVDSRNRWPLIRFVKYQISPRFSKPISHSLAHPAIERDTVEANRATVFDEWNLSSADTVVERNAAHAEVPCRGPHVEPPRFADRMITLRLANSC